MIKAVIFDLDGTLIDTLQDLSNSINLAMKNRGYDISYNKEETKNLIGSGTKVLCKRALSKYSASDEDIEEVYKEFSKQYRLHQLDNTKPYNGVKEGLLALKRLGCKIAVLSNKVEENTKYIINSLLGESLFDIVRGQRINVPLKPDPTSLNDIIEELFVKKEEVLYVGDSDTDMKTADNLGVKKVAVTWGFRDISLLLQYKPDYVLKQFSDIVEIVKNK